MTSSMPMPLSILLLCLPNRESTVLTFLLSLYSVRPHDEFKWGKTVSRSVINWCNRVQSFRTSAVPLCAMELKHGQTIMSSKFEFLQSVCVCACVQPRLGFKNSYFPSTRPPHRILWLIRRLSGKTFRNRQSIGQSPRQSGVQSGEKLCPLLQRTRIRTWNRFPRCWSIVVVWGTSQPDLNTSQYSMCSSSTVHRLPQFIGHKAPSRTHQPRRRIAYSSRTCTLWGFSRVTAPWTWVVCLISIYNLEYVEGDTHSRSYSSS